MNKKFLSAILFGALMVSSTGTFVSCKDYDDDIDNLQEQINKLATKEDMTSQIATLQAALTTAAKDASRLVFAQNNAITVNVNFQSVFFGDVESSAQLDRQNHATEFIHFANDTCRFHEINPPCLI